MFEVGKMEDSEASLGNREGEMIMCTLSHLILTTAL